MLKHLGIFFTYKDSEQLQKNCYDKLKDIRLQTRLWRCRGLSLFGKVTIIKSFLLPKMLYVLLVVPVLQDFIKQLNTIIYNFLWNGPDKIAQSAGINDTGFGGVNPDRLRDLNSIFKISVAWKAFFERFYTMESLH